ncbi:MAG: methyltransferase [Crocinitomicaceae bacterium]|jgi:predicted O-methyltransferase YrrM|nr:methyltransferase [Crocinitomicaceae bacterium]
MEFIAAELDDYVCKHSSDEPAILQELNRETHLKVLQPRMLSGHFQGRLLSMISKMARPERILEIGTYTGYSALCLAEGLTENGKLITIDVNEELEPMVRRYISKSDFKDRIDYRIGNAMELIPELEESFDIVFIDADKQNYLNYYTLVFDKVKPGGLILTDNVLWSGKVIREVKANDKETKIILEFNEFVKNDPRAETILLPIRDGIMLTRKK